MEFLSTQGYLLTHRPDAARHGNASTTEPEEYLKERNTGDAAQPWVLSPASEKEEPVLVVRAGGLGIGTPGF